MHHNQRAVIIFLYINLIIFFAYPSTLVYWNTCIITIFSLFHHNFNVLFRLPVTFAYSTRGAKHKKSRNSDIDSDIAHNDNPSLCCLCLFRQNNIIFLHLCLIKASFRPRGVVQLSLVKYVSAVKSYGWYP